MASANEVDFNSRLSKIHRQHRKSARGFVRFKEQDGLLIPVTSRRRRRSFTLGPLLLIIGGFMGLKALLFSYLGPNTYADRIDKLADGTLGEQFGAWVMGVDPVTAWIAPQISMLLALF